MGKSNFFDGYLLIIAIVCSVAILIDWLIGPKNQDRTRSALESIWICLDDNSHNKAILYLVLKGESILGNLVGIYFQKIKSLLRSKWVMLVNVFAISTLIQMLYIIIYLNDGAFSDLLNEVENLRIPDPLKTIFLTYLSLTFSITIGYVFLNIGGFLSYLFVRISMFIVKKTPSIFMLFLTSIIIAVWTYLLSEVSLSAGKQLAALSFSNDSEFSLIYISSRLFVLGAITIGSAIYLVPCYVYLGLNSIIILLNIFGGALYNFLKIVLLRLSESKKGVLTQISIGLGMLAKLAHELLKIYY